MPIQKPQTFEVAIAGMLFVGLIQSIRGFLATILFLAQRENITEESALKQIIQFQANLSMTESLSLYLNIVGVFAIIIIFITYLFSDKSVKTS